MKIQTILAAMGAAAVSLLAAQGAQAAAYAFTSAPDSEPGQQTLGFTFSVNQTFTVTSLGFYDDNGDGFISPHEVGIYAGDGLVAPGALLAITTLAAGKSGTLGANDFRYQAITPVTLIAGQSYTVAGLSPNYSTANDPFVYGGPNEIKGMSVSPWINIAVGAARFAFYTPSLVDPSLVYSNEFQIYAVDFDGPGLVAPALRGAVPEPATWAMLLVGFGGVGGMMRRARRGGLLAAG